MYVIPYLLLNSLVESSSSSSLKTLCHSTSNIVPRIRELPWTPHFVIHHLLLNYMTELLTSSSLTILTRSNENIESRSISTQFLDRNTEFIPSGIQVSFKCKYCSQDNGTAMDTIILSFITF
jgi:hypothetical protein